MANLTAPILLKDLYVTSARPFVLEHQREYEKAIQAHEEAATLLKTYVKNEQSSMLKFNRKMIERQMQAHTQRRDYLKGVAAKNSFAEVILLPTILSANAEIKVVDGKLRPLSLDHQIFMNCVKDEKGNIDRSKAPDSIRNLLENATQSFSSSLDLSLPPTVHIISHSSELIGLGQRSHWMYIKDKSNTHTLWALQVVWSDEAPIREALLRRVGEFLPGAGAVHVDLIKMRGGALQLKMQNLSTGTALEVPDRGESTRHWAPRRFEYGGRMFVWKEGSGKGMFPTPWETLYEVKRVWPKAGSQTGKMEDELVGGRLCWGEKNSSLRADHKLYFAAGLDQHFREHLLASQLTRYCRRTYPPKQDNQGVGTAAATGLLALVVQAGLGG